MTPRTILIIDDDRDYVRAIRHLFESHGDTVVSAPDGRAGFERAREVRPDVILLDVMMTEPSEGFFTLQRIKRDEVLHDTSVIVVTSVPAEHPFFTVAPEAGWLPADGYLAKPVRPELLLETAARMAIAPRNHDGTKTIIHEGH